MDRRKSIDSSSSSDSSSDSSAKHYGHGKVKKDKKDKKKDKKVKDKKDKSDHDKKNKLKGDKSAPSLPQAFPQQSASSYNQHQNPIPHPVSPPMSYGFDDPNTSFPSESHFAPPAPPTYAQPAPPPSGYRVPLSTDTPFPGSDQTGWPPLYDADGSSPVFIGSALFENSVHPCKIGPHLNPPALVPYAGTEHPHFGRYDLLPFVPSQMEWVPTSYGQIPPGRRPIEGGYEESGDKLYHALANINGVRVPGKAGEHLRGCNVPFAGQEHSIQENYEILCWK